MHYTFNEDGSVTIRAELQILSLDDLEKFSEHPITKKLQEEREFNFRKGFRDGYDACAEAARSGARPRELRQFAHSVLLDWKYSNNTFRHIDPASCVEPPIYKKEQTK